MEAAQRRIGRNLISAPRRVAVPSDELLLGSALADAANWVVLMDYDGTVAPFVKDPQRANPGTLTRRFLSQLPGVFGMVAFVSGRPAEFLHQHVGIDGIHYVGNYGADVWAPGAAACTVGKEFVPYIEPLQAFGKRSYGESLRKLGVLFEDKGVTLTFHWRGSKDPAAAETAVLNVVDEARRRGWSAARGEMNWEVRPPISMSKRDAAIRLLEGRHWKGVIILGDEMSDVRTWEGAEYLRSRGQIDHVIRIGVASDHTPPAMAAGADRMAPGVRGVTRLLGRLARAQRVSYQMPGADGVGSRPRTMGRAALDSL